MEFTKDYVTLIEQAKKDGNTSLAGQLSRQRDDEIYLQDEGLQRSVAERAAKIKNAQQSGTSFEGSVPGKKI